MRFRKLLSIVMAAVMAMSMMIIPTSAATPTISLNKTSITLAKGKSYTLTPTVTGKKSYKIIWTTSKSTICSVDSSGKVTAKKNGTAKISAKIEGTSVKATCVVKVGGSSSAPATTSDKTTISTTTTTSSDAMEFVKNIKIGWNLGNTLDALKQGRVTDTSSENAWGNPTTTKAMIDTVKKAGFNAIRIPVSWGQHMDANGNIDKVWMDRVQTIVDYAVANDMYIILNTHHEGSWVIPNEKNEADVTKKLTKLWSQISDRFKNYDEKLIFEYLNEPRTENSAKEWSGGTKAEREIINNYYKAIHEVVRKSGGNNATRYVMITPYAAASTSGTLGELWLPEGDANVIVSVHCYSPYHSSLSDSKTYPKFDDSGKKEVDSFFNTVDKYLTSKGIPVIIGEFGTVDKSNTAVREEIASYYKEKSAQYGIPCFWWDDGGNFKIFNRNTLGWFFEGIKDVLTK